MQAPVAAVERMRTLLCSWAGTPNKGNIASSKLPAWLRDSMGLDAAPHLLALTKLSTAWLVGPTASGTPTQQAPTLGMRFPDGRDGNDAIVVIGGTSPLMLVHINSRMQHGTTMLLEPALLATTPTSYPPPYVLELRTDALRAILAATPTRECPNPCNAPAPVRMTTAVDPDATDPFFFAAIPEYSKSPHEKLAATISTPRAPGALTPADYERILHAAYAANTWAPITSFNPIVAQGYSAERASSILASFRLDEAPPGACHYTWARVETRPAKGQPASTSIALVARLPHLRLNPVLFETGVNPDASARAPPCNEDTLRALRSLC